MTKSRNALILSLVIIVGLIFGAFQTYNRTHLSSDLRITLTAAMDPSSTEADVESYLRQARLQIHTKHDAVVDTKLEQAITDNAASNEADKQMFIYLAELGFAKDYNNQDRINIPEETKKANAERQIEEAKSNEATSLFNQVRVELGLQPVKTQQ